MSKVARKFLLLPLLAGALMLVPLGSDAAQLPSNCTKTQGTVVCTTFDGPGNNQAGVGETTVDQTQGNTSNFSPAPQEPGSTTSCKPPKSQGNPCF
jgi:hypothetical protein